MVLILFEKQTSLNFRHFLKYQQNGIGLKAGQFSHLFALYFALFITCWVYPALPGSFIKIIKCIVRAKVARKVSPKVLHLLFNKLCLKMTDQGSRSTWGPGPSRSRLRAQKYDLLPLKQTFPTTFVLYVFT
jgi:hypothetical protein